MKEYKLEFFGATIPNSENTRVLQFLYSNKAFAVSNGALYELEFFDNIQPTIRNTKDNTYPLGNAKLLHVEAINDEQSAIIVKVTEGIRIYLYSNQTLNLAVIDDQFHDLYEWNKTGNEIYFGHFYHDASILGMMSSHVQNGTKFYAIFKDDLLSGDFPIYPLDTNTDIFGTNSSNSSARMLADLKRTSKYSILSRNPNGLSLYELNEANGIDILMNIPHVVGNAVHDKGIYFADLTHQKYNDIVHFNSSGMFVYQYDESYKFINYNPLFSKGKGWKAEHTKTVRFLDLNRDGYIDMMFTGPKGISAITYKRHENIWSPLIEPTNLPPSMRHAQLMHVIPKVEGLLSDSYVVANLEDSIYLARVVQLPFRPIEVVDMPGLPAKVIAKTNMTPLWTASPKVFEKTPLLRDMSIWTNIINSVNRQTGKPKFSLPLINLPDPALKLILHYDATSSVNDVLGIGWSMPLNVIALDDRGSIFEEEEVFVIAFQDGPQALKFMPKESSSDVRTFALTSRNENLKFRAKFYPNHDHWVIDLGNGVQQFYGQLETAGQGALLRDVVWKNWHGAGFDNENQMERTRMWYLAKVQDEHKNTVLEFFYDIDTVKVNPGLSYTKAVYINRCRDYQGHEIKFRYQEKDPKEYKTYDVKDQKGNYIWEPVQTRYLSGYTFTAPSYLQQKVDFVYSSSNGNRLLQKIHQSDDVINKAVAEFDYLSLPKGKFSLKSVLLPYDVKVNFSYAALGDSPTSNVLKRIHVASDYKITTGDNYVLVSFINGKGPDQVILRMFNKDFSNELYTSDSRVKSTAKGRWPLLGEYKSVVGHDVIRGDEYFGVILYYASSKWLCLFGNAQQSDEWLKESNCHEYGEKAVIEAGRNFCLVSDPGSKVDLIEWKSMQGTWNRQTIIVNAASVEISVHKDMFVTYDDNKISLGYKITDGTWSHERLTDLPNCHSGTEAILNRFNLKENIHKLISAVFRNNQLKFNHNLIAVNCLELRDHQLQSSVHLYTLDRLKKLATSQQIVIKHDNLDTFITKEEEDSDGNFFQFKYEIQSNGDFNIKCVDFRGPLLVKLKQNKGWKKRRNEIIKQIEETMNSPAHRLLFDFQKYIMSFSDKLIRCGDQKLTFGGNQWQLNKALADDDQNFSIPLGNKFVLEKKDKQGTIKLLKKDNHALLSSLTVNATDLRVFYPVYMATLVKGESVRVLEFDQDNVEEKKLSISETLSPYSSPLMLITHEGDERKIVIFRQQYGIKNFLPNHVVHEVAVVFDNDGKKRVTGYEYDVDTARLAGNTIVYSKYSTIPGNDKNLYGWLESSLTNGSSIAYNNKGEVVRYIPHQEQISNDEEESKEDNTFRKATTIFDKSGMLEIAQCAPYVLTEESVGYYGFEDYETNVIGSSKQWKFENSNVIRNGFSLTGKNYLHQETEPIEGIFEPIDQNIEYIASSWIRLQNNTEIPQIGEVTPYLKAIVLTTSGNEVVSLLSQVKFRLDDWIYLELILDFLYVRKTFKVDALHSLQIAIRVGPTLTTYTDIDNVRFVPLISDFNVKIFDAATNLNTAVIQSSGPILRRMYDIYDTVVGEINEQNQIEELTVYTKTGVLKTPRCTIKIRPEMGFYEQFAQFSFANRWKITEVSPWMIAPYQLEHHGDGRNNLQLSTQDITTESFGFRLLYSLNSDHASFIINDSIELSRHSNSSKLKLHDVDQSVPQEGEILLVKEKDRVLVWIDGGLHVDQASNKFDKPLKLTMSGMVSIKDMMVFSRAFVKVIYQNSFDEPTQEIFLESSDSIVIKEKLYDELGRQCITTQPVRIYRSKFEPLLAFIPNFITNDGVDQANSIWKTGLLDGLATKIIGHPYGFTETQFESNPLNEKTTVGLPGKDFSSTGSFSKRFTSKIANLFVTNRFPLSMNVSYQVELKLGGIEDITVLNEKKKKIAHFVHVPGGKDLFSTYKLNDDGNLLQALPPLYFEKVGTFHKTNLDLLTVGEEDYRLQRKLGVHIEYDQNGKPIRKTTADAGPLENVYDGDNLLRFVLYFSYAEPSLVEKIIYFTYDPIGRLLSTGRLIDTSTPKDKLLSLTLSGDNSVMYQSFNYGNFERDPTLRGRLLRTITMNGNEPFAEVMCVNESGDSVDKRFILPNLTRKPDEIAISKSYLAGRLQGITYPAQFLGNLFVVVYGYDRLGRVSSIGLPGEPNKFLRIDWNAAGQVIEETYEPDSIYTFKNLRDYNEPGFLIKLHNPFQSEEVSYTESSYGGANRGDGSVTRIKFSANWHGVASSSGVGLNPNAFINESMTATDSRICFEALKNAGYLNEKNRQIKAFYPDLEIDFPIICTSGITGRHVSNVLGRFGYPSDHGYRFDYGAHQDLTKAKYFVGSEEPNPLQPDTFAKEIHGINIDSSRRIWKTLKAAQFLVEDPDRTNLSTSHGKESQRSFIGSTLFADLKGVNPEYTLYTLPLRKLLTSRYFKRQGNVSVLQMKNFLHQWLGNSSETFIQRAAADIFEILSQKRYFLNPLDPQFQNILSDFRDHIPEIVRVLFTYFGKQLGRSEFDVESYEIDANGNHRVFNTGYNHYSLKYERDSNRVEGVQYKAFYSAQPVEVFQIQHDSRGNVIQALHKGIVSMEYHAVSNLLQRVTMVDGNIVEFYYDSKGERVLKRLTQSDGKIRKEMHYLRDDQGRTLVERELSYLADNQPPAVLVTMYVYGPNGLVGFIRRDQFFSVITDHQGSVRLIVRDGEVVAAYDYLPYGDFMRIFGTDPEAHIPYRYTGQEWDPEISLYNYHARFYDPSIGRFYQIDPKEQYFSPYKYAGNSPVSMVDPTGEVAFLVILPIALALGAVGGYLGGAAANDSFYFSEWDEGSIDTYLGIIFGAFAGALLPVGFVASAQFLAIYIGSYAAYITTASLGLGMAYLSAASANGSFYITDWDFSSPATWSALFDGFATGATAISNLRTAYQFYKQLNASGKKLFITATAISGTGLFIMGGIATDWDLKTPQFWFAAISSVTAAPDLAMFGLKGWKAAKNGWKDIKTLIGNSQRNKEQFRMLHNYHGRSIVKSFRELLQTNHELASSMKMLANTAAVGVFSYLGASALNHGFSNWNMTAVSTYQNLITAIQMGGQFASVGKQGIRLTKQKLRLRKAGKALKLTDDVAYVATQLYEMHLEGNRFDANQRIYNGNSRRKIAAGQIPNTAMTVAVTDNIVMVGFSSNKASGLYVVFDHNKLTNPWYIVDLPVDDNGRLGTDRVAVRDNQRQSEVLTQAVDDVQNGIKDKNREEYNRNLRRLIMERAGSMVWIDPEVTYQFIQAIHHEVMLNGFVQERSLQRLLETSNFNRHNGKIQQAEFAVREARTNLRAAQDHTERNRLTEVLERAETKRQDIISYERSRFLNAVFRPVEHFQTSLTNWDISNCAEPHTLLALERQRQIFNREYFHRESYDIQLDIKYMATYKIKHSERIAFQRCDHCMVSTSLIKNVLTDNAWMDNLKNSAKKSIDVQFLMPIINLQNIIKEEEKKENDHGRQKRSIDSVALKWYKRPFRWIKNFRSLPKYTSGSQTTRNKTVLELGDEFLSKININGAILLADVILAKCQNRKLHQMSNASTHQVNSVELLCNILQLFEDGVEKAAEMSGVPKIQLNMDSFTMQQEVMPLLRKHQFARIPKILLKHALAALDSEMPPEIIDHFSLAFVSLKLEQSMEEMLVRNEHSPVRSSGIDLAYNATHRRENMTDTFGRVAELSPKLLN